MLRRTLILKLYQFNDPKTDVATINYNLKRFGEDRFKQMQFVFFISEEWLNDSATDSGLKGQSWIEQYSRYLKPLQSVGKELDPSAYNLPIFLAQQYGEEAIGLWKNEIFNDKGPLFIIQGDGYQVYNYLDTGNFIWGYFMDLIGYSLDEAISGAKAFNPNDTEADLRAINNLIFFISPYKIFATSPQSQLSNSSSSFVKGSME